MIDYVFRFTEQIKLILLFFLFFIHSQPRLFCTCILKHTCVLKLNLNVTFDIGDCHSSRFGSADRWHCSSIIYEETLYFRNSSFLISDEISGRFFLKDCRCFAYQSKF